VGGCNLLLYTKPLFQMRFVITGPVMQISNFNYCLCSKCVIYFGPGLLRLEVILYTCCIVSNSEFKWSFTSMPFGMQQVLLQLLIDNHSGVMDGEVTNSLLEFLSDRRWFSSFSRAGHTVTHSYRLTGRKVIHGGS
jgi:hypothetical protein